MLIKHKINSSIFYNTIKYFIRGCISAYMRSIVTYNDILKTYTSKDAGIKALEKIKQITPIYSSTRLAGIVGDLFGDGHLQGPNKWRIDYTSGSVPELKRFGREIYIQFGRKGKIRKCTTNKLGVTYNYGFNNKPIARVLFLCGVPAGNKVMQNLQIPSWILNNKFYFTRFIQRLFDCEGSVSKNEIGIELNMSKSEDLIQNGIEFFNTIKFYLSKYHDIKTCNPFINAKINRRKDNIKTHQVRIKIRERRSAEIFSKKIKFENLTKQRKLILSLKV